MGTKSSVPRYYIRDNETNEMWCFDARYYSGQQATV
ncbi:MAG: hypothetical protein JWL85_1035 [Candidatus Saccharibacteria bacterium]|nr:hypothetical protein [Candidatus Saccharibacteria bacterium]